MTNREIKFRAWDKVDKRMIKDVGFSPWQKDQHTGGEIYIGDKNKNFVLMQYTGLKDKNEKEIYEGDCMIRDDDKDAVFEVFYHDGKGAFDCARVHYHNARCGTYVPSLNNINLKVIGNIYENPELIQNHDE